MGWDAYSSAYSFKHRKTNDRNVDALKAFTAKADEIREVHNEYVDCMLPDGGLDLQGCRNMIQEFTDIGCYEDLTSKEVQEKYRPFPEDAETIARIVLENKEIYYYSAKAFLEVCIEHELGIKFSY
jgi:hypothetical protein